MSKRYIYKVLALSVVIVSLIAFIFIKTNVIKNNFKYPVGFLFFAVALGLGILSITFGIITVNNVFLHGSSFLFSYSFLYLKYEFFKLHILAAIAICIVFFAVNFLISVIITKGARKYLGDNENAEYKNYKQRLQEKNDNKDNN